MFLIFFIALSFSSSLWTFLQVIDLASVAPELAYLASDADLVILEGMVLRLVLYDRQQIEMKFRIAEFIGVRSEYNPFFFLQGRGIETNLYAQLKCDSVKIGMVLLSCSHLYFFTDCGYFLGNQYFKIKT